MHLRNHTRAWQKALLGNFCIDTTLDAAPVKTNVVLRERQLLTCGNAQHFANNVLVRYRFRNAMLNLYTRVHFHEVVVFVGVKQKLNGARRRIAHRFSCDNSVVHHVLARFIIKNRRGALLNHFLVVSLHRAIAFAHCYHIAMIICDYLYFNMARLDNGTLQIHRVVTKRVHAFALCNVELFNKVVGRFRNAHTFAAATR